MSDSSPAWIEIGGPIPLELVPELIDCIRSDGLSDRFGSGAIVAHSAEDLLALASDAERQPGTLKLYDEQAPNGEFLVLESFLEERGIAFDRNNDGGDEYSPELVRFRPGWLAPTTAIKDNLGREAVLLEHVREALGMLRAGRVEEGIAHLAAFSGEEIPPIMPLEFVD